MHNEKDGVSALSLAVYVHGGLLYSSQFPITAIREIKLLKALSHPNILQLREMAIERTKGSLHSCFCRSAKLTSIAGERQKKPSMYMVMPYLEHDLSGLLENPAVQFSEPQIKCYLKQLLEGLRYLHAVRVSWFPSRKILF